MKKILLILYVTTIIFLAGCSKEIKSKSFIYEGKGDNWNITMQFNKNDVSKIDIYYTKADPPPDHIQFAFEHLSGITSSGIFYYGKSQNKYTGTMTNDDTMNDDMDKYNNKNVLKTKVIWNNKTEEIELKKITNNKK